MVKTLNRHIDEIIMILAELLIAILLMLQLPSVVEIITNYSITFLPMLPDFVRGIINLRGDMIPILDIRLRLGKETREDCLVIVLSVDGTQLGILVDSVDQMLDIPKEDILPTPVNHTQKLVSGMVTLPDGSGTMMVLACEELLPHD